jgi:hypothetical protein
MRCRTPWLAATLALAAASAAAAQLDVFPAFGSRFVVPREVTVWLPDGYATGSFRFPVIYMQDGQNLYDGGQAFGGEAWQVDKAQARRASQGRPAAIVVGIWNTPQRYREYMPQGIYSRLPPQLRGRIGASHGGAPLSDAYLRFLVEELKPFIDARYRTRPEARSTSIMGSSMGGLISLYAMAEYPQVFGQAACLSIHWPLIHAASIGTLTPADAWPTVQAVRSYLGQARLHPGRNRLYYDRGDQALDATYAPYATVIDAAMPALGWHAGRDWVSRYFPGGAHDERSWRARLEVPLAFLLDDQAG